MGQEQWLDSRADVWQCFDAEHCTLPTLKGFDENGKGSFQSFFFSLSLPLLRVSPSLPYYHHKTTREMYSTLITIVALFAAPALAAFAVNDPDLKQVSFRPDDARREPPLTF